MPMTKLDVAGDSVNLLAVKLNCMILKYFLLTQIFYIK